MDTLPSNVSVSDVEVRLSGPDERVRWDRVMNERHELGFHRFAGRGLRYVALLCGLWVALAGWQVGALKCRPRDRFIGWTRSQQFERLHLISSNTRFLILGDPGQLPNLASCVMARMLRRLSGDWHERWGHPLELAETFVDPRRHEGTMYVAGNWTYVGRSKGYARGRGGYTDPHGKPKKMFVYPLTSSSCARLCAEEADPDWEVKRTEVEATAETLPCLLDELRKVSDFRRGQGRKHKLGTVLAICVLARLAGKVGCDATSRYAAMMPQEHLEALEAWKDKSGEPRFHAPSRATIHRVMMNADSDELQAAATRWAAAHPATDRTALAVDGKRINGVNRTGAVYHETATIVTHDQGIPIASRVCNEEGGERAAALALLEDLNIAGATITMDALHTTRQTADRIVRTHRAHYLFSVKGNAPETFQTLQSIDWEQEATATFSETSEKEHGRVDRRHIACLSPLKRAINFPHVKQIFRVERHRYEIKTGKTSVEHAYGITSLPASEASPEKLLCLNRRHWSIENKNHRRRDTAFLEDGCLMRSGNGPANNAVFNNMALAIILSAGCHRVPAAIDRFEYKRDEALQQVLATKRRTPQAT